mgnify:FL=1|jgi:hypothetical protein
MRKYFMLLLIAGAFGSVSYAQKTTAKTASKPTAKAKPKPATTVDASPDALKYSNSNKEEEIAVDGKDVVISGHDNKLIFTGKIGKLIITGKDNDITAQSVAQIIVTGNGNFVSWEKAPNGKPILSDKGGYNNIEKRSSDAQIRNGN